MKVLYIGGTGTISTSSSHLLANQAADLTLLTRGHRITRSPVNAKNIFGDINNPSPDLLQFINSSVWDCVVNWVVYTPGQALRDIEIFRNRTKQYIFISSSSVYRTPEPNHKITESDPLGNDLWVYAQDKIKCERIFQEALTTGFPVTIVRPSHSYNEFTIPANIPGLGYGVIKRMIDGKKTLVHDDGYHIWTLTHGDDFAVGLYGLIGCNEAIGEVFNITSSETLTWRSILDSIGKAIGITPDYAYVPSKHILDLNPELGIPLFADRARSMSFDNTKIKRFVPSFEAGISFESGLQRSLEWHKNHPDMVRFDPTVTAAIDAIIAECSI